MYDVDGNGVIDQDEMTRIIQVRRTENCLLETEKFSRKNYIFFQAIYDMLGAGAVKPKDTAEERAKNVFMRFVDNLDNDDG